MPEPRGGLHRGCSSMCDPGLGEEVRVPAHRRPRRLRGAPGSVWRGLWKRSSPDPGCKWAAQTACPHAHPALPWPSLELAGGRLSPAMSFRRPLLRKLTIALTLEFQLSAHAEGCIQSWEVVS